MLESVNAAQCPPHAGSCSFSASWERKGKAATAQPGDQGWSRCSYQGSEWWHVGTEALLTGRVLPSSCPSTDSCVLPAGHSGPIPCFPQKTHTCTHTCIQTCGHKHTHTHIHAHAHSCPWVHTCSHVYTPGCEHTCARTHMQCSSGCTHARVHIHTWMQVHTRACTHMYGQGHTSDICRPELTLPGSMAFGARSQEG